MSLGRWVSPLASHPQLNRRVDASTWLLLPWTLLSRIHSPLKIQIMTCLNSGDRSLDLRATFTVSTLEVCGTMQPSVQCIHVCLKGPKLFNHCSIAAPDFWRLRLCRWTKKNWSGGRTDVNIVLGTITKATRSATVVILRRDKTVTLQFIPVVRCSILLSDNWTVDTQVIYARDTAS